MRGGAMAGRREAGAWDSGLALTVAGRARAGREISRDPVCRGAGLVGSGARRKPDGWSSKKGRPAAQDGRSLRRAWPANLSSCYAKTHRPRSVTLLIQVAGVCSQVKVHFEDEARKNSGAGHVKHLFRSGCGIIVDRVGAGGYRKGTVGCGGCPGLSRGCRPGSAGGRAVQKSGATRRPWNASAARATGKTEASLARSLGERGTAPFGR